MKNFSNLTNKHMRSLYESITDGNSGKFPMPGNLNNGIMNNYIPIENIVINVRNIFAPWFGLVVEPGEDKTSLKIYNSTFTSESACDAALMFSPDGRTSLLSYVTSMGLNNYKKVKQGNTYVLYFYNSDIAGQEDPSINGTPTSSAITIPDTPSNQFESNEIELHSSSISESSEETEMRDVITKTFYDLASDVTANGADEKWAKAIGDNVEYPYDDCYWALVKDEDGYHSIALRHKYEKRLSFGRKKTITESLINIYNNKPNGIWVGYFDKDIDFTAGVADQLSDILYYIGAEKTKDDCVWGLKKPLNESRLFSNHKNYNINEGLSSKYLLMEGVEPNILYTVYNELNLPVGSYSTKEEADEAAAKYKSEYDSKVTIKKENIDNMK